MDSCKQCEGAPFLSLEIEKSEQSVRPHSVKFNRKHAIVQKDFYRGMKADTIVTKHIEKKKGSEMGRAPKQTLLEQKNLSFKTPGEVISDVYARSALPESRLYMIDKVVRMRGQHGRFGIDHSELLNYELEQTNKPRDDHMNWLVYKKSTMGESDPNISDLLFTRLKASEAERFSDYSNKKFMGLVKSEEAMTASGQTLTRTGGLPYAEWLKLKDAEKRLKKKLIT